MIRFVGATVDEVLAVGGCLRLLGCGLSLISLRSRVGGSGRSLVGGGLSGLGRIIRLNSRIRGVGSGLVGHSHPSTAIPALRRVRTVRGVNPQGRSLAHRRGRCRALDKHVGLAVRHASGGSGSGIRLPRGGGRVGGGLCRTIGGGLGLSRHARRIGSGGLGIGRIRLGGGSVGFGGFRGFVGGVGQRLRIACGLLRAFGGGLGGIGRILGLTGGRGSALRGGIGRIGGILRGLRRTSGRVSRALRVFRGGSGILGGLLGVGGLRGIVRDVGLRLSDFVGIALHVGIAHVVPRGAIPDKRLNHAISERHEHGGAVVGCSLPVRVEVGQHGRRIILLTLPASPILLRLEPQVADDQIVLRLVRPTKSVILRVGFGIRLRRRFLGLADLAIRGGQVAFGLGNVLLRLRQIGLGLGKRFGRRVKTSLVGLDVLLGLRQLVGVVLQRGVGRADRRLIGLDVGLGRFKLFRRGGLRLLIRRNVLLRLRQLRRIILQSRLIISQIFLNLFDLIRRDSRSHGHSGDGRPGGAIARMVHRAERIGVLRAAREAGHKIIALTGLRGGNYPHSSRIDTLADLDVVEVGFHRRAGGGLAIPVDGHHAQFRGKHRLRRHGARGHVGFDGGHDDARPFAELVGIRWHGAYPDLDLSAAVKVAEAQLRLVRRSGRMPRRTVHVLAPLDGIIADLNGRVIGRFGHCGPHGGGQAVGETVRADVGVGLHDQTLRSLRHAMVTVGRGGRAALATGQRGTTSDALDFLRLTHGSVIFDVVQGD